MRWLAPLSRWLDERLRIALAKEISARVRILPAATAEGHATVTVRTPLGASEHEVEPGRELLVGSNGASINRPASHLAATRMLASTEGGCSCRCCETKRFFDAHDASTNNLGTPALRTGAPRSPATR